ncbi:ferritin-like domain-containing protein [Lacibacterium aquatile]|uniref:Ferritin-like domain-containing protein n=1 Tax=Lacibacterium aquatile TaxID=1168082 RepID=A0ABW5DK37_9PROT
MSWASLSAGACAVLATSDAREKANLSRVVVSWARAEKPPLGDSLPGPRPARPDRPELLPPNAVPRRRLSRGTQGRVALLHALAHIELNAIDLAWDILARFTAVPMPEGFYADWLTVADEEAIHFLLLADRLAELGAAYGDLAAHDGLWQAAERTSDDLLARLAIVPMVLEARGLDVTPQMIERLEAVEDPASAAILKRIHDDEIGHVASGRRWFDHLALERGFEPRATWQEIVTERFRGGLKRPFNEPSRTKADFPADWYEPLVISIQE